MTTSKTFRATINGTYAGNTDPAFFDTLALSAGVVVQASHFEQLIFGGDNDVTITQGPDFGKLTLKGLFATTGNHLHFADASACSLSIMGQDGLPPDYTHLKITGVVGSSIQLDRPNAIPAQFTTDGTINVGGNVWDAKVGIDDIAGDATIALTQHVDYIVQDQAEYRVSAGGDILVTANGHTITIDYRDTQAWHLTDSAGVTFSYVHLVGAIEAAPGDVFVG